MSHQPPASLPVLARHPPLAGGPARPGRPRAVAWRRLALGLAAASTLFCLPARAVLTLEQASEPAATLEELAGVARLDNGCSAVLLAGGRHLLGAAHCAGAPGGEARFPARPSQGPVRIVSVALAPGWAGTVAQHDLSLMTLEAPVTGVPGYRLATMARVEAAPWVLVTGFGAGGTLARPEPAGQLHWGRNEYDARMTPAAIYGNRVALFDFDDGSVGANTLGRMPGGRSSLGLGADEAMLGAQDSGGPTLVQVARADAIQRSPDATRPSRSGALEWQVAGIHAAVDARRGSRPGGLALDTLVAPYGEWLASIAGPQVLAP